MPGTTRAFLEVVAQRRGAALVVTTMTAAKIWPQLSDTTRDINYLPSAMGHASDVALGLALAEPRTPVICVNGDGSLLMNLGSLATIAAAQVGNLTMLVLDNGIYRIVGRSPVPGGGKVQWDVVARAAGWKLALHCDSPPDLAQAWPQLAACGPALAWLSVDDALGQLDERLPPVPPGESLRRWRSENATRLVQSDQPMR